MQRKQARAQGTKASTKSTSIDIDIAHEFDDVKNVFANRLDRLDTKLDAFKDEISAWRAIFESKLTELNTNMKNMLERLSQHDFRFTEHDKRLKTLEDTSTKNETRRETMSDLVKFGWWAAKALVGAGIMIGGVLGTAQAWKTIFGT